MTGGLLFGELVDEKDDREDLENGDLVKRLGTTSKLKRMLVSLGKLQKLSEWSCEKSKVLDVVVVV
jgi:hypothetical protein